MEALILICITLAAVPFARAVARTLNLI